MKIKQCPDGYPSCRNAEATGQFCEEQCQSMIEFMPLVEWCESHNQMRTIGRLLSPAEFEDLHLKAKRAAEFILRRAAFDALRDAETKMHAYACSLDIGEEREKAFAIFDNIRNAARVGRD